MLQALTTSCNLSGNAAGFDYQLQLATVTTACNQLQQQWPSMISLSIKAIALLSMLMPSCPLLLPPPHKSFAELDVLVNGVNCRAETLKNHGHPPHVWNSKFSNI